jgi:hypothetical protein
MASRVEVAAKKQNSIVVINLGPLASLSPLTIAREEITSVRQQKCDICCRAAGFNFFFTFFLFLMPNADSVDHFLGTCQVGILW